MRAIRKGKAGRAASAALRSGVSPWSSQREIWRSVITHPGAMAFTRMFSPPSSVDNARQPHDGRLGCDVADAVAIGDGPGDRGDVDDRAAARILHVGPHVFGGKQLMLQIHRDAIVEISGRDVVQRVAVIAAGVVDECRNRAECRGSSVDDALEQIDMPQVARLEIRNMAAFCRQ